MSVIKKLRINERIFAKEIRLVGEKGEQLGIMTAPQALEIARKQNLDLVEVAPTAEPPVCRIIDYGRFRYEQAKKEREQKKGQKVSLLREIRLRPKIGEHDFLSKYRSARKLLEEGNKLKVTVMFRGREITHPDLGWKLLKKMSEALKDVAAEERPPVLQGKGMSTLLVSLGKTKVKEGVKETQDAKA
ncbi:MAG: translation initiation factor IF-3 [Chloroflexota bacterium]